MKKLSIPQRSDERSIPRPSPLNERLIIFILFTGVVIWSLLQSGIFQRDVVNEGGWSIVWRFLRASVQPDLSAEILGLTLHASIITLAYAVCGTTLSLAIGVIGGILSSELWWELLIPNRRPHTDRLQRYIVPWLSIRAGLAIPRSIHEIIWGLFFINIFGLDPLTAILAIGIPYGAITAKVFAEMIDETPRGALNALRSGGIGPFKALLYSVMPQAFPYLLSYALYRLECALRTAAILGLIGAGGLGYQILLSLQSLRYEQIWTFLYALIVLVGLSDAWSSWLNRRLNVSSQTNHIEQLTTQTGVFPKNDRVIMYSLLAIAILIPFSFWYVQPDLTKIIASRTVELFSTVISDSFPPRLDPALLRDLTQLAVQTFAISVLAMTIAGFGGLVAAFPAATNVLLPGGILDSSGRWSVRSIWGGTIFVLTRMILLVTRSLSEGIWVLLVLFLLFPGPLPGAIGLGLYNLGVLGRLMTQAIESVDQRPLRALKASGASAAQIFLYGLLPKTLPRNIAYVLYRWEVCARATVVVGIVGAGGLGRRLAEQLGSFDYRSVVTTLIFYMGMTFIVDVISAVVRRTLR